MAGGRVDGALLSLKTGAHTPTSIHEKARCSEGQGEEDGGAALAPELGGVGARPELDGRHVTWALAGPGADGVHVERAHVDALADFFLGRGLDGLEVDDGHRGVELHGERLGEAARLLEEPPRALEEHAVAVGPFLGRLLELRRLLLGARVVGRHDGKVPQERVDRQGVLAGRSLKDGGKEAGRVGEPREPVDGGDGALPPAVELLAAVHQIARPRRQGLERRVGEAPFGRNREA
mmetsp:Transcript_19205/g.43456  ORF Transcript_19205/g.43456 Transcript_19205/m.43456 type:complete len:235 (+) Transcript_19205:171-875(+)